MNGLDVRARYTRQVLEDRFLALLKEKPWPKITVTELCRGAQLNRATFYKHYRDVPDLMDQMEGRVLSGVRSALEGLLANNADALILGMTRYMARHGEKYMALGSVNGDPALAAKTMRICYEAAYPILTDKLPRMDESRRSMLYDFLTQGCGGVLTGWLRGGMRETPEEVAELLTRACWCAARGFDGAL